MRTRSPADDARRWRLRGAVAGCALDPPPTTAELQKAALPRTAVPPAWKAAAARPRPWPTAGSRRSTSRRCRRWSPRRAYNADLQVAAARVEQAAGYVKVAGGALLPSVGVFGCAGASRTAAVASTGSASMRRWSRRLGPPALCRAAAAAQSAAVAADYGMRASRSRRWWPRAGSSRSRPGCRARSRRSPAVGGSLLNIAKERLRVGNGNEQAVAEARGTSARIATTCGRSSRRARMRCAPWRCCSDAIRRRRSPSRAPLDDAAPFPVGMPSQLPAPARRRRRRASRCRRVQPRRRSERGATTAHQPDRRRQQRGERPHRAEGHEQSHLELRREPDRAPAAGRALCAQVEIRWPSRSRRSRNMRAPASGPSAKSKAHSPPRTRCAIARPSSRPAPRQRACAGARQDPVRVGAPICAQSSRTSSRCSRPHRPPARADGAAGQRVNSISRSAEASTSR